jgi:lipopolysaccharide export system protein LptA
MPKHIIKIFLICVLAFSIPLNSLAQEQDKKVKKIVIKNANSLEFDEKLGANTRRLIGDVVFQHEGALMYCDSAYFYSDLNSLDAFGKVKIVQGDSIFVYGDKLYYNGTTRKTIMKENIKMINKETTLTTNNLEYDLSTSVAMYFEGGKIISSENNNTITSRKGYFYSNENLAYFNGKVVLENPDYNIYSDTLKYHTTTEIAYFFGPTEIVSKENYIYCENGFYDTKNDFSIVKKNSYLISKEQKLQGDSMVYDRVKKYGEVFRNIQMTDTVNNVLINGEYGKVFEETEKSYVTGKAFLTIKIEDDSLYIHADTLKSEKDSSKEHRIFFAYNQVKFFKNDLQGMCDSLVYTLSDSLINLYYFPVIWADSNQIKANHISIKTKKESVDFITLTNTSSIISKEDSIYYNQIFGKDMKIYFVENEMDRIEVFEDGKTIYFSREEDDEDIFAMNKSSSKNLVIRVKKKAIKSISFLNAPDAKLTPIDEVSAESIYLSGFYWYEEFQPKSFNDIFDKNFPKYSKKEIKQELSNEPKKRKKLVVE